MIVVIFKYINFCGVVVDEIILVVYERVFVGDLVLVFGGIVVLNKFIDVVIVKVMIKIFLECVVVFGCEFEVEKIFKFKFKLRVLILLYFK